MKYEAVILNLCHNSESDFFFYSHLFICNIITNRKQYNKGIQRVIRDISIWERTILFYNTAALGEAINPNLQVRGVCYINIRMYRYMYFFLSYEQYKQFIAVLEIYMIIQGSSLTNRVKTQLNLTIVKINTNPIHVHFTQIYYF